MKAIMVMFDSLNRHMLPNYGCDWIKAPNFLRLGMKSLTFENSYAGSLPCMPARRELHTGRYNFLHRSWGPVEPFDDSMPEILKNNGVYTHLVSDHQHYWEDGGCTYHTRYSSWEISRGQEGDPWKGVVGNVNIPDSPFDNPLKHFMSGMVRQDQINRRYMQGENCSQGITFKNGIEFIEENKDEDKWFLQIETFDPHEPFFSSDEFREMYPDEDYDQADFDWPPYAPVFEDEAVVCHGKKRYAALLSMCDYYLGKVLDKMDEYNMWEDTMLIVNTDHGYLLGEHGWWAKSIMPTYNEIAHTPLFIWDPRFGFKDELRSSLVQAIDLAPTLLDFFNVEIPSSMEGKALKNVIAEDSPVRKFAMFGYHGSHINITDGRYLYMKGPARKDNTPLYEYTLMPTHMRSMFKTSELQDVKLVEPFDFTKGCRTMKINAIPGFINPVQYGSKLFDLKDDPKQLVEIDAPEVEVRLTCEIARMMKLNDAPSEQYERMGIQKDGNFSLEMLAAQRDASKASEYIAELDGFGYQSGVFNQLMALLNITPEAQRQVLLEGFIDYLSVSSSTDKIIKKEHIKGFAEQVPMPEEQRAMALYFMEIAGRTA
ncbi:MAG: sulfatase [Spirochaetales bacterium]|nr:sulfatase [Spirochaetales bacterium]